MKYPNIKGKFRTMSEAHEEKDKLNRYYENYRKKLRAYSFHNTRLDCFYVVVDVKPNTIAKTNH